jgi:hypothetical protein
VTVAVVAPIFRLFAFNAGSWPEVLKLFVSMLVALIATLTVMFLWNLFIRAPAAAVKRRDEKISALAAQLEAADRGRQMVHLRERIKTMLGEAHTTGERLFSSDDKTAAEEWVTSTHAVIKDAFGPAEAAVFLSDAGFIFLSGTGEVRNWIKGRLQRLILLIQRCDTISIRENFTLLE